MKKQTPSSSLYRLILAGKDFLLSGLWDCSWVRLESSHMAAGGPTVASVVGKPLPRAKVGMDPVWSLGRWDCLQDLGR